LTSSVTIKLLKKDSTELVTKTAFDSVSSIQTPFTMQIHVWSVGQSINQSINQSIVSIKFL